MATTRYQLFLLSPSSPLTSHSVRLVRRMLILLNRIQLEANPSAIRLQKRFQARMGRAALEMAVTNKGVVQTTVLTP